jgi:hypothetical protein
MPSPNTEKVSRYDLQQDRLLSKGDKIIPINSLHRKDVKFIPINSLLSSGGAQQQ